MSTLAVTSRSASSDHEKHVNRSAGRTRLQSRLAERLAERERDALRRTLRIRDHADRADVDLSSNDYLGLAHHPHLVDAVRRAAETRGVGSGSSRLISGTTDAHAQLEQRFAAFKHAPAALLFPTGYMANLAVLTALTRTHDLIVLDKHAHASLIDGARLAHEINGATYRTFRHRDLDHLRDRLRAHRSAHPDALAYIVTDSVFSMDGDLADLAGLRACADAFEAVLVVDEAHGTGVLGASGEGLDEDHRADLTISTASKALGCLGGIVTADTVVIDAMINDARSFIYTTAVPPTQVAAIDAALDIIRDEPERRERLAARSRHLRTSLRTHGLEVRDDPTPIVPVEVGDASEVVALSERLQDAGFIVPAIRPPTVPRGRSRLRISLHCDVSEDDIDRLVSHIARD